MRRRGNEYLPVYVKFQRRTGRNIWGKRLTAPAAERRPVYVRSRPYCTNNKSDKVRAHHQQDIEDAANNTRMTIPLPSLKLRTENKVENRVRGLVRGPRGNRGRRTIDGVSTLLAMTSVRMKSTASQPHAKSLGLRSCQRPTNVKINALVATSHSAHKRKNHRGRSSCLPGNMPHTTDNVGQICIIIQ
jgi:hypothetical protein